MLIFIVLCVLLLIGRINSTQSGYWHAVDPAKEPGKNEKCAPFQQSNKPLTYLLQDYKMWPGLTDYGRKLNANSTVYGMEYALEAIWKHQHPEDCSKVKFLINGFHNGGFGSEIHVLGAVLGLGLAMGRVVLQNPFVHEAVMWETDNPFCQASGNRSLSCYYEPWSSCTVFDALGPNAMRMLRNVPPKHTPFKHPDFVGFPFPTDQVPKIQDDAAFREQFLAQHASTKTVMVKVPGWMKFGIVPPMFAPLLACSSVQPRFHYYWWRAISTAYIMRPNAATLDWLSKHRMALYDKSEEYVSIYIRRGDKSIEAKLPPVHNFTSALGMIYERGYMEAVANEKRLLFVASEDSKVLASMKDWVTRHKRFEMHYTEVFDRQGLLAERSAEERSRGGRPRGPDHHPEEYLSMLLNVHYLVRGSAYICTLSSNFCRVIDELRATVAAKADRVYVDLSEETCAAPPCFFDNLKFLDWR